MRSGAPRQFLRFAIGAVLLVSAAGKLLDIAQEKAWKEEPVQYMRALRRRLKLPDPAN